MEGTIAANAAALRSGAVSASELAEAALARIEATDDRIGAYLTVTADRARAAAAAADRRLRDDPVAAGVLCGIPVAIKDVLCVDGVETTAGSKILQGFVPPYTGTAVQRLIDAGAVIVGKTNCDEFAMGSSNENSAYRPVHNPWDLSRVPGGSSGGSAAAVAAATVPYALGTDTGGSIRQPAALCGVAGFKPTYGRVSRHGLIAFASSLDQIGPFAQTVEDAALVYRTIAGDDPMDNTTAPNAVDDPMATLRDGVKGLRLGVPREYFSAGLDAGVRSAIDAALGVCEGLGATIVEVSLPTTEAALSAYYIIAPAECSSNLSRMDGVRFGVRQSHRTLLETYSDTRGRGFGPEVKRRIMLGTHALSSGYYDALYRRAEKVRTVIAHEFSAAFEKADVMVSATSPIPAFPLGAKSDPLAMYLCDALTIPVNLAGLPGISVPCGFSDGLPVGLQIVGPRFEDSRVLRVAHTYEQATEWHRRRAPLAEAVA